MEVVESPTFRDVVRNVYAARYWVVTGGALFLLLAVFWCYATTPYYSAYMLVAPTGVTYDSTAYIEGVPRFLNQDRSTEHFSFLRFGQSLTGVRVSSVLLKDPAVVEGMEKDRLFFLTKETEAWTAERISEYLKENIRVEPVKDTQLQRISYNHPDRLFAKKLLEMLYVTANELIRTDARREAEDFIAHLEAELEQVRHPQHRETLTSILMDQEQIRILTNLEKPFAALMAEPPVSSVRPVWPRKVIVFPIALFLGFAFGLLFFNIRQALK